MADDRPFIGSEAVANGLLKKHQLRADFRAVYPDVYLPREVAPTIRHRARAAWLWSHRQGVIAGLTASAMHGSKWVDEDLPIELVWSNARRPRGLRTYDMRLYPDEFSRTRRDACHDGGTDGIRHRPPRASR